MQKNERSDRMLDGYVAMYLRISDDDEDIGEIKKESLSIGNQRKVLQYFISHDDELSKCPVKEFLDDGFSGVNFNRPGMQNLLSEVRKKKICCIVVKDLSRFGRNYVEVGDYIEQIFPFIGVRFISVSDNYDSFKNDGGLEIGFKNLIHDFYSRDLSKKIKSVKQICQQKGKFTGGDVPFGYRRNKGGEPAYLPDPITAEIVRKIFALAIEGKTPGDIARELNKQGIGTPGIYKNLTVNHNYYLKNEKHNYWTSEQVRIIIQNEAYIGTHVCHKLSSIRPRESRKNEINDYIKHENAHEALISKDDFEIAQHVILSYKKRGKYKEVSNTNGLKGKVKCGNCGYGMTRAHRKEIGSIYCCRMGASCGSYLKISEERLEQITLQLINQLIGICTEREKKFNRENGYRMSRLREAQEEKRILEMKQEHCRSTRLLIYRQWKEGKIEKEKYMSIRDDSIKQEEILKARYREITDMIDHLSIEQTDTWAKELCFKDDIQELSEELVDKLIDRIEVYGEDRIKVVWKFEV